MTALKGPERALKAETSAALYLGGRSIRQVAVDLDLCYGTARNLLIEQHVPLRRRGGSYGRTR